jgi:glycosyltransferase involved in cell wall biosynthesis
VFSIILPLYNKAKYIEKAVFSIHAQTFNDFELIVVDDGSTDDGLTVLRDAIRSIESKLEKGIFDYTIVEQTNQGVSVARNNGVKIAKYQYIAFLDADDWWEATYLEEMHNLIKKYPSSSIYGCSYYKVKRGTNIRANIGVDTDFQDGLIDYFKVYAKTMYMPLWTGATIVRSDVFRLENGFKPKLKGGEDFELWVRIAHKFGVAFLNKPLAYYNQDVDIATRAVGSKLYEPEEHVIFCDFGDLNHNEDFRVLFEILAVYALLPYYLSGKFKFEVDRIISTIRWENHAFKYRLYFRILPRPMVKLWFWMKEIAYLLKGAM